MTDIIEFKEMSAPFWSAAQEMLMTEGDVVPIMALFHHEKNTEVFPIAEFIRTPKGKDTLSFFLRDRASKVDTLYGVLFVTEAWVLVVSADRDPVNEIYKKFDSLEDHPERVEKLVLTIQMRSGKNYLLTADINRDEDGKVVSLSDEEQVESTGATGRLFDIFPVTQ